MTEAIQVLERRFGLVPTKIDHHGKVIQVDGVDQCWTEMQQIRGKVIYHYQVRCGEDRFCLSEDAASGNWTMEAA